MTVTVLVLVKGLGMGGAERLLVDQVCTGSPGIRYVVAYARPDKTHYLADLEAAGVEAVCLASVGRGPWSCRLATLLRRRRPDVVHSHSPLLAAVARVLVRARVAGRTARHVTTEHNRWPSFRVLTRIANAATMPLDAATWAVSEETRRSVWPPVTRRRVVTLHHGVDVERVRREGARPAGEVPEREGFVFVHIANRRPNKAHEVLLDAFSLAVAEVPTMQLWLVGQWLDTEEFSALLAANPAADRISVLGARPDAVAVMSAADALVLSSDHEGLPVVVMEALALGTPIVSTAVGGVAEACRDGVEGLLVPPREPALLASAMVRLASSELEYRSLVDGASARSEEFDARVAQHDQVLAYRRLAGTAS